MIKQRVLTNWTAKPQIFHIELLDLFKKNSNLVFTLYCLCLWADFWSPIMWDTLDVCLHVLMYLTKLPSSDGAWSWAEYNISLKACGEEKNMKHNFQRSDNWLLYYTAACDWHCAHSDWQGTPCQNADGVRQKDMSPWVQKRKY